MPKRFIEVLALPVPDGKFKLVAIDEDHVVWVYNPKTKTWEDPSDAGFLD